MNISNEVIAAYADGTLPEEYLPAVRRYLSMHPEELEEVLLLMDSSLSSPVLIGDTSFSKVNANIVLTSFPTHATQEERNMLAKEKPRSPLKKNNIMFNITELLKNIL